MSVVIETDATEAFNLENHTILIIDDNPNNLAVIIEYLKKEIDSKIQVAQSGELKTRLAQEREAKEASLRMNQELADALQQLQATQAQLVEAEKMASLGGLVAGIAHEINTPIGIGLIAASTLASEANKADTAYKNKQLKGSGLKAFFENAISGSNLILNNLERASKLIKSFKQVAVDQSNLEKRDFAVKSYIEEILLSLKPQLKKNQHHITIDGEEYLTICSYPGAFSQIITNLIMNSLAHAYQEEEVGYLSFAIHSESEQLVIEYQDDGCGIPAEHLSKVFEPFFTTKRGKGGTGLGMHITHDLITKKLNGTIKVKSVVGTGTTFTISLPLVIDD